MTAADGLDEIADRLYALPPADFTAARDDAARAARAAGDRSAAAEIAKLRRPTVAAWIVNLLALQRPETIGDLLELGVELRRAQLELRGTALRDLTTRRRAAVGAMVREAAGLAIAAGASRSTLPLVEVETTLTAALADAQLADVVRAGRLLKSGAYDGFGGASGPRLRAVPDEPAGDAGAGKPSGTRSTPRAVSRTGRVPVDPAADVPPADIAGDRPPADTLADESPSGAPPDAGVAAGDARQRLEAAAAALAAAEAARAAAVRAIDDRTRQIAEIEERLGQLRRDRLAAHAAVLAAQAAGDAAEAALESARRRHAAAVRAVKRRA